MKKKRGLRIRGRLLLHLKIPGSFYKSVMTIPVRGFG